MVCRHNSSFTSISRRMVVWVYAHVALHDVTSHFDDIKDCCSTWQVDTYTSAIGLQSERQLLRLAATKSGSDAGRESLQCLASHEV